MTSTVARAKREYRRVQRRFNGLNPGETVEVSEWPTSRTMQLINTGYISHEFAATKRALERLAEDGSD